MNIKQLHWISGLAIIVFTGLHFFNHFISIFGADRHISVTKNLRLFYRNMFVETTLLLAVFTQIISGLKLFISKRKTATTSFDKLQIWTGLYLAVFL